MNIAVKSAGGCAWRGRYLYLNGAQIARVVLDPNGGTQPSLVLALPVGWYTAGSGLRYPRLLEVRIPLPYVPWSWCMRARYARPAIAAYRASQWLYHGLDGRYGWGSAYRRGKAQVAP